MQNEAHVDSWYAASANLKLDLPPLNDAVSTDVCIIGAGYTGLSAAIHLRQLGYTVTVLEANRVAWEPQVETVATWAPASGLIRNNWRNGWG